MSSLAVTGKQLSDDASDTHRNDTSDDDDGYNQNIELETQFVDVDVGIDIDDNRGSAEAGTSTAIAERERSRDKYFTSEIINLWPNHRLTFSNLELWLKHDSAKYPSDNLRPVPKTKRSLPSFPIEFCFKDLNTTCVITLDNLLWHYRCKKREPGRQPLLTDISLFSALASTAMLFGFTQSKVTPWIFVLPQIIWCNRLTKLYKLSVIFQDENKNTTKLISSSSGSKIELLIAMLLGFWQNFNLFSEFWSK